MEVQHPGGDSLFAATVLVGDTLPSPLFRNTAEFAAFIAQGVTSYGLSRYRDRLTQVDLHKEDRGYQALEVLSLQSRLVEQWEASGAVLDSAFRTRGGYYQWTYQGLRAL